MAEKQYHKGWLYERDGVKFAPYTLKENLIQRDGSSWSESVDNELGALTAAVEGINTEGLSGLESKITDVANRATTLEERTQYMDATASDVFYITDANGNIALKVDSSGATSFNFNTSVTDLNSLAGRTESLEGAVAEIHSASLAGIREQIVALQERTKYMDASSADDTFYITDGNGNIAAKINASGITSFDFISQGVTSLNALYAELQSHGALIEAINGVIAEIKNADIPALQGDIESLQTRTKFVDASNETSDTFYVTDGNGNIAMKVNQDGVTSFNFVSQGVGDLNSLYGDVDTLTGRVDSLEIAVPEIKEQTDATISALTNRVQTVETRTKYMDASNESGAFYITDGEGNIGMKVDNNGITTSVEFIIDDADGEMKVKETLNSLIAKDETHDQAVESLGTRITNEIAATKNELNKTITTTKEELSATIDSNVKAINDTISSIKTELDDKDTALGENIASLAERAAALESRTKFMDASEESGTFAITDGNGNIGMLVDNNGVTITDEDDFIIKNVTSLKTVNTNLNTEISNREKAISELINKNDAQDQALTNLETNLTKEIKDTKTSLEETIKTTKETLEKDIDDTAAAINQTITTLEEKVDTADEKHTEGIATNVEQINLLKGRMNTAESDIDKLQTESATKEELEADVATINATINSMNEAIGIINNTNATQDEALSGLATRAANLETRTKYMDASDGSAFYITDVNGNIGMVVDGNGVKAMNYYIIATDKTQVPLIGYEKKGTIEI